MNASVEGTEFVVRVDANQSEVSVIDGVVGVCNSDGNEVLTKGQRATAQENAAPERVKPVNAVQWALYYPILGTNETTSDEALTAYELANSGQAKQAIEILDTTPEDAYTLALKSTIAVANNEIDNAEKDANKALDLNQNSPSAWMAKSYVQQARFDLPEALSSVEKANGVNPNDAIILARLAELRLSNDDKSGASDAAEQAKTANPDISRTQTVLGFMRLSQFDIDEAKESFNAAIELDESDPLPRLGLGLANIRKNEVEEGKRNIEIAVSLDPGNSLLRSYLGIIYFEDNSINQAIEQLGLAEMFDSKDPTPNLYRAFVNQTNNQPSQALTDLQISIKKNDNRAVYRSRLNLDKDISSKSILQSRIYNEMKFDQRAQFEASKSLIYSPTNSSAHRFLSDSYLFEPDHEIARVSELLQAQLRQPLQRAALQMQLLDSRLGILNDTGAFESSYNENTHILESTGVRVRAGISLGSNNTYSDDFQLSHLGKNAAIAVNQFLYNTEGFRENNDLEQNAYNLFTQYAFNEKSNVQLEMRKIDIENGELFRSFNPDDFSESQREDNEIDSTRIGFFHKINKNTDVIGSFRYETQDSDLTINFNEQNQGLFTQQRGKQAELQSSYKTERLNLISGIGLLNSKRVDELTIDGFSLSNEKTNVDFNNVYFYTTFQVNNNLSSQLGISWDDTDTELISDDEVNPKLGFLYDVDENNSIRFAYFETLKRSILADQTIEPTSILGFNQFFDEGEGTKAEQKTVAWDGKYLSFKTYSNWNFYYGASYIDRDLDVPVFDPDFFTGELIQSTIASENNSTKLYFYSTFDISPEHGLSFGLEYTKNKIKNSDEAALGDLIINADTKQLSINLGYFNSNGLSLNVEPTYYKQSGLFDSLTAGPEEGSDDFWLFDLTARWKFPSYSGQLVFSVDNIFDKEFSFVNSNPLNSEVSPERAYYIKIVTEF